MYQHHYLYTRMEDECVECDEGPTPALIDRYLSFDPNVILEEAKHWNKRDKDSLIETNTLAALCFFALCVVFDACISLEPSEDAIDAPSALRSSSLVAVFCMAAPDVLSTTGGRLSVQRCIFAFLVAMLAFLGSRMQSVETSTGDATYTSVMLFFGVLITKNGGIEYGAVRKSIDGEEEHIRRSISCLCPALMLYIGCRGIIAALSAPGEVMQHTATVSKATGVLNYPGYAYMSASSVAPLAFGHTVLACTGVLVMMDRRVEALGTHQVSFQVTVCASVVLVCALLSFLSHAHGFEALRTLYEHGACSGAKDLCSNAYRSRRMSLMNTNSCTLWIASLGSFLYACALEKRVDMSLATEKYKQKLRQHSNLSIHAYIHTIRERGLNTSAISFLVVLLTMSSYYSPSGSRTYIDISAILSLLSIGVTSLVEEDVGMTLYTAVLWYYNSVQIDRHGAESTFGYLTNVCLWSSAILQTVYICVRWITACTHQVYQVDQENNISPSRRLMAVIISIGTSISVMLFVGFNILLACYNGGIYHQSGSSMLPDGSGRRAVLAHFVEHFVPLMMWFPLCLFSPDVYLVSKHEMKTWMISWTVGPFACLALFFLFQGTVASSSGENSFSYVDMTLFSLNVPFAFFGWLYTGMCVSM